MAVRTGTFQWCEGICEADRFQSDQIIKKGVSFGGTSVFRTKEIINISQLKRCSPVGGIGNFSKVDLARLLPAERACSRFRHQQCYRKLFPVAVLRRFRAMMQLTYLDITSPRKDNEAFESYKNRLESATSKCRCQPDDCVQRYSDTCFYTATTHVLSR
ncbi:hypothetical protein [Bacteroides acidifaciens]|uniref:hypothetical protein n=1 Tax=Bacteroides acidifaciens TaxID=85831 RepID=UPI003F6906DC